MRLKKRCCCRNPLGQSSSSTPEPSTEEGTTVGSERERSLAEQVAELEAEVARLLAQNAQLVEIKDRLLQAANGKTFLVRPFPTVADDKDQALKPLEEAAEAFGAWQTLQTAKTISESVTEDVRRRVVEECADVIQAAVNLAAAVGVSDMTAAMMACYRRNHERGRC